MKCYIVVCIAALQVMSLYGSPIPDNSVTGSVDGNNSIGSTVGNLGGAVLIGLYRSPPLTVNSATGQPGNASAGNGGGNGIGNGTGVGNGTGGGLGNGNGNLNGNGGGLLNGNGNGNNNGASG